MNEDKLKDLLNQDANLREAIREEEMACPQMPPTLNARLMQRVEKEVNQPARKRIATIWPWVAAACVAAVLVIFLTPPKDNVIETPAGKQIAEVKPDSTKVEEEGTKAEEEGTDTPLFDATSRIAQPTLIAQASTPAPQKQKAHVAEEATNTAATPTQAEEIVEAPTLQADQTLASQDPQPEVLTKREPLLLSESDIPITRPENLRYTKEELALMKKQANEAYLKWMELELEISKYNIEQTAQK